MSGRVKAKPDRKRQHVNEGHQGATGSPEKLKSVRHLYQSFGWQYAKLYPEEQSRFRYESRSLGNYLARSFQKRPPHCASSWIVFECSPTDVEACVAVNSLDRLVVTVPTRLDSYFAARGTPEKNEAIIDVLLRGLALLDEEHGAFARDARTSIEAFRAGGYRNEWILKNGKVSGRRGLCYEIRCTLDTDRFATTFRLLDDGDELYKEDVFATLPDEMFFLDLIRGGAVASVEGVTIRGAAKDTRWIFEWAKIAHL